MIGKVKHKFHLTPIQSKDGKISQDDMNKMDHKRFHNNIKDQSINLKKLTMEVIHLNIKNIGYPLLSLL